MAEKEQLEFVFQYDPSFRIFPSTTSWVGPSGPGDLRIDFFVESIAIPNSTTHALTGENKLIGQEISRSPERRGIRVVQASAILSLTHAKLLIQSIQQVLKLYEDAQKGK